MKKVVSVSLGSSERDSEVEACFGGQLFKIQRIGADGSLEKVRELLKELDGKVDALSLGGTDLYLYTKDRRYTMRQSASIISVVKKTPVVDGSGIKNTLERRVIPFLEAEYKICFKNKNTLLVCAIDRFGLAESLENSGAKVIFGDLIFGMGLPIPIKSLNGLSKLAKIALPVITRLPVSLFYPTGKKQNQTKPKFPSYFNEAEIIAGDFHFIRRYMPDNLKDKLIVTNTVTKEDEELLKKREIRALVTTTPEIGGRSFGANILEGILVALAGKYPLSADDYTRLLIEADVKPRVKQFS